MTVIEDHVPFFVRTEADIRADFDLRANAGLSADDPAWVDTRPGSMFHLTTQGDVIEFAKAYDRMNEAVAAAILVTSWDEFLDRHAASFNQARIPALYATGTITFEGDNGTIIGSGTQLSPEQTDPEVDPPVFITTASGIISGGTLDLPIRAVNAGVEGNVAANAITQPITGIPGVTSLTNADATTSGADEESDPALKTRLIKLFGGNIWGTKSWYENVALAFPGVGAVTVIPHRDGAGTVALEILGVDGAVADAGVVTALKDMLDITSGMGEGLAPANHYVTVEAVTPTVINVKATVTFEPGYSLDGTTGGVALRDRIEARLAAYFDSLRAGDDVIINHVSAQFFSVHGVHDITGLKIGTPNPPTASADVAIDGTHTAAFGVAILT